MDTDATNQARQRSYELLIQAVGDYAIYMLDLDGNVVSWNAGAANIKGYSEQEIIGKSFSCFYAPEDRAAGRPEAALHAARTAGRYSEEGWRVRKDGSRFWASTVIDAIRNEAGDLIGFAKITHDLTERRAALQAIEESERDLRLLIESVTDYAIYMLDSNGIITRWNNGAQRIKGYTANEVIGKHFSTFYTPEERDLGVPEQALQRALAEGRYDAEGWRVRKDGSPFRASVVIDPIRSADGRLIGFAKITKDITERYESEKRLQETREQLFQAQKMEALGRLTGGLAHDFNNLLTAILGGASLALNSKIEEPRISRILGNIRDAAERGASLTRKLLAFARRQSLEPKPLSLSKELSSIVQLLRPSIRSSIEIILDLPDDLRTVEIDSTQLELALLNLAFNARDAMPDGGTLRIAGKNVTLAGKPDGLHGEFVALSICDTGSGIPLEIQDRIFEPFFTTKQFGQGTGLGLSQVYGFAKQSRGTITLESVVGSGTTFTLFLPVSAAELRNQSSAEEKRNAGRGRVLIVEDDPIVTELAADLLAELKYETLTAGNALDALAILTRGEAVDAVFSDIIIPGGMNGVELARRIRNRFPELPILLTTGYSDNAAAGLEFPLLRKPYQLSDLARAMQALL
ncbi:MAG TPA: PAS domain S-box protein [Ferrovibrio sp.]|uniref:hybrid sensor histidine kinase/response regulator n=1 Tax=Ferrovibrio sp. TaxID=1917215 RepID=UPI002ED5475F